MALSATNATKPTSEAGTKGAPAMPAEPASSAVPQGQDGAPVSAMSESTRKQAMAALQNSLAFSQIIGVLMQSQHYKHYSLSDLEWLVLPPLTTGQFKIGEAKPNNNGLPIPVAVVFWASVSAEVDERLTQNAGAAMRLRPDEWKSGNILWLVGSVGQPRFVRHVLSQLVETTFKGRDVKIAGRDKDGKPAVQLLQPQK
jgi:cytolysin-activating lysine-acyltransferase